MSISASAAKALCKRVLAEASFGDVRVHVRATSRGDLRFGAGRPTTGGDIDTLEIAVTASKDGRHATVTGNADAPADLAALVQRAEALAALAPVDPEAVGPLGKVTLPRVIARDGKVASMDAADRATLVGEALEVGIARGVQLSGHLQHGLIVDAFADRAGLAVAHEATELVMTCTARTSDGTGSSKVGFRSHGRAGLSPKGLVERAAEVAIGSRAPKAIDPGEYTVVLLPDAVAELLDFLIGAMGARAASEGRSFFSGEGGGTKLGTKAFDERVVLWSDPADRSNPASPLGDDGRPQTKVTWVDHGVVKALHAPRGFAITSGLPAIPEPTSIHMAGGDKDIDELVAGVARGILVTRLWYNRMLDPRRIAATGLTRDGTFFIEGGKLSHPIKNLRYNDGPVTMLSKLVALGRPERAGLFAGRVTVVPPLVVEGFRFDSVSDSV